MKTNMELCVNLKTELLNDPRMVAGKWYIGRLCRKVESDEYRTDDVFTFKQIRTYTNGKRNTRVYDGKHITITVRNDGTYRPNFKPMREEDVLNLARYTHEVYVELCEGLGGLIDEG